jgi:hypothetical protein
MSTGVYANLESIEGNLNGNLTHTLARKSRQIVLTNDSADYELKFKFNESEEFATLKPTETISMTVWVRNVILQAPFLTAYRLWVYG